MEGFVHIIKKTSDLLLPDIKSLLRRHRFEEMYVYDKKNNFLESFYFTNENNEYNYPLVEENFYTPTGIFTEDIDDLILNLTKLPLNLQKEYISKLSGAFSLSYSNFETNSINVFTHFSRIENVYLFENNKMIIVGTDPLVISLISNNGQPEFNEESMYSFILNGYYTDELTPYKNIKVLPSNSMTYIDSNKIKIEDLDDSYQKISSLSYSKADYDRLTDEFLTAFDTLPDTSDLRLPLTGGMDSRLIFAAMKAKNFDFVSYTNGFKDNADVIIAKNISKQYGIEHSINEPVVSDEKTINIPLYNRLSNLMNISSGMVYGYENGTALGNYKGHRSFDGVGGGTAKGGYSAFSKNVEGDKEKLIRIFTLNEDFLIDKENNYKKFLENYIDNDHDLHNLQLKYFLNYRIGRFTSAVRSGNNYTNTHHSPFLDNLFMKSLVQLNYDSLINQEVYYEILRRLDSTLIDVPFAGKRWRFESDKPKHHNDFANWMKRRPIYSKNLVGNYNWRALGNNDKKLIDEFKRIILDNPNHLIFNIVDYEKIKKVLNGKILAKHSRIIWSVASIIVFTNEYDKKNTRIEKKSIRLKLPATKVTSFKGKKDTKNLVNDLFPLNNSLKLRNNTFTVVSNKLHRKVKMFDNKFTEAPNLKNLKNYHELSLRINITSKTRINIQCQILFFKDSVLIKKDSFVNSTIGDETELHYTSSKVSDYDSYKILINFKNSNIKDEFKINYVYSTLTQ